MLTVDTYTAVDNQFVPTQEELCHWACAAYRNDHAAEVALSVLDTDEMQRINFEFRQKNRPTNVLSFPAGESPLQGTTHIGDVILCAEVINREAIEQDKTQEAHWAHMVIHGMLHLQGYDHVDDKEAQIMESLEIVLLKSLNFKNPYLILNHAEEATRRQ
jgi:probable rRNA maturation factor